MMPPLMLSPSRNRPVKTEAKIKQVNQYGTGMRMAQSSHGPLPPPSKCNKYNSNSVTSALLEGGGSVMEGAAIPAVATAAGDSNTPKADMANIMEPTKQEEGGIPNNTRIKDLHGKEAINRVSSQGSSTTRYMNMRITMEDAASFSSKGEATTSGRSRNRTVGGV